MKKLIVLFVLMGIVAISGIAWWTQGFRAPDPQNSEKVAFVIPQGANVRQIGNDLKEAGLIKDPIIFFLYIRQEGLDKNIQAGSYVLAPSMNLKELVDSLRHGSVDVWVRITEGQRAEEVAEQMDDTLENYDPSWDAVLIENEGWLYPDSYLIPKDAQVEDVLRIINNNFDSQLSSAGIDPQDPEMHRILTIASLIEREALVDEEKPLISSVIHNRLNSGMALDIDATLQYAKGKDSQGKWWSIPRSEDTSIDSPYNTYLNPGLPPGPIGNPGIGAIKAAVNPEESSFYFYIHDSTGEVHFAETLEEHNENIQKYLQ